MVKYQKSLFFIVLVRMSLLRKPFLAAILCGSLLLPVLSANAASRSLSTGDYVLDYSSSNQDGALNGIKIAWSFPAAVKETLRHYSIQPGLFSTPGDTTHVYLIAFNRDAAAHEVTNKIFSFSTKTRSLTEIYSEKRAINADDVDQVLVAQGFDGKRLVLVRQKFATSPVCVNPFDQNAFLFFSLDVVHPKTGLKSYKVPSWLNKSGAAIAASCASGV